MVADVFHSHLGLGGFDFEAVALVLDLGELLAGGAEGVFEGGGAFIDLGALGHDGAESGFLGFEFVLGQTGQGTADAPQFRRYAERFPGDRSFADLARWAELERETPDLFDGYVFWCMRI
jgi:hypothetical protein